MPTRFYLPDSTAGAPNISPNADSQWEQTGEMDRVILYTKANHGPVTTLTNKTVTVPITTTQQIVARQYIGPPMYPKRITGTVSMVIRCSENANTNNAHLAYVLRVLSQDGGTVRGILASFLTTSSEFPLTASAATRIHSAQAITALTTLPGDRLCMEIGVAASGPTAAGSAVLRCGTSASSDFALTAGLTTDLNPWFEISDDVFGGLPSNYQFNKAASSGVWLPDRIR